MNPRRTLTDFPKPQPLPLGAGVDKEGRYYGQTCKLLRPIYASGFVSDRDFPLALDGEFGMYQGTRSGFQMQGGGEVAVIKFAHCTGLLPDDGTWFEVID